MAYPVTRMIRAGLTRYALSAITVGLLASAPVHSQSTVGNGTIIAPATGIQDTSGVPRIGGEMSDFATRHYSRADNSGIGGSFIGTSSPTSESSPAVVVPEYVPQTITQFRLPKLDTGLSQSTFNTPAIGSESGMESSSPLGQRFRASTPALPSMPGFSSRALSSPLNLPSYGSHYSGSSIEEMPSFSRRPSTMEKMEF